MYNNDFEPFSQEYLNNSTILYIEDDEKVNHEATQIFKDFFQKVYSAHNGKEGLNLFLSHASEIDIILTDLNLPELSGLELIQEIRRVNKKVPVLIATAFNEPDVVIKAIKLNIANYILKPMQMQTTLKIFSNILEEIFKEKQLQRQQNEFNQFFDILDQQNLICESNLRGEIIYANDLFCNETGYAKEELLGSKFNMLRDKTVSRSVYKELWECITNGNVWKGKLRNMRKDGSIYYIQTTIMPLYNATGEIYKYRGFSSVITKSEEEKLFYKKQILSLKSGTFRSELAKKSNEKSIEELSKQLDREIFENHKTKETLLTEISALKRHVIKLERKLSDQEKRFEDFQEFHYGQMKEMLNRV